MTRAVGPVEMWLTVMWDALICRWFRIGGRR